MLSLCCAAAGTCEQSVLVDMRRAGRRHGVLSISSMAVHPVNSSVSESIHCSAPRMAFTHVVMFLLHTDYIVIGGKCAFAMLFDRCVYSLACCTVLHLPPSHARSLCAAVACAAPLPRAPTSLCSALLRAVLWATSAATMLGTVALKLQGHGAHHTLQVRGVWRLHWEVEGC